LTPHEIVDLAKRKAHFGILGNDSDQASIDLLSCLNIRAFDIWRFSDWEWLFDAISISVGPGDYEKTFPATTGELMELNVQGQTGYLIRHSRRQYLQWLKQANTTDSGVLTGYIHTGRDASGNIKVRFFATPSSSVTVEGWAKKRFVKLTASNWSTAIPYFPEEVQGVLYSFVQSDAYDLAGDARAPGQLREAFAALRNLRGEEDSQADLEVTSPPPDRSRFTRRHRKSGTRVV